jgi:ATP-dependent helicase/DNAse subunit B
MPQKLSFSKISTYISCPRKYFLSYVCKLGTGSSPHMTNGSILHKCFEDFANWPEEQQNWDNLVSYYYKLVPEIDGKDGPKLIHEEFDGQLMIAPSFEQKALSSMKSFYEDYMLNHYDVDKKGHGPERDEAKPKIILQEEWFNLKVGNGHEVRGLIDRVDEEPNGEHIIDYKSGQTRATYKALEDPLDIKSMQLSIYALARWEKTGKIPHKVSFFYVEPTKGSKKQEGQYRSARRTPEQLLKVKNFIGKIANEIEECTNKKEFPIGDSPNCFFCDFKNQCEILAEQQIIELNNKIEIGNDEKELKLDNSIWEE